MNDDLGGLADLHVGRHELRNACIGLIFGIGVLYLALYWIKAGRVWNSYYGWIYRNENPSIYWLELVIIFIAAVGLIGYFGMSVINFCFG